MTRKTSRKLKDKQVVYRQVFKIEAAKEVLADLRAFCYATQSMLDAPDISAMELARREGRREVFMQIMNMLEYDYKDYYEFDPEDYIDG